MSPDVDPDTQVFEGDQLGRHSKPHVGVRYASHGFAGRTHALESREPHNRNGRSPQARKTQVAPDDDPDEKSQPDTAKT
jgi:hypothetical protein